MKLSFGETFKLALADPEGKKHFILSIICLIVCFVSSYLLKGMQWGNMVIIGSALLFTFEFQEFVRVFARVQIPPDE